MATSDPPPQPEMLTQVLPKSWSAWLHPQPPELKFYRDRSKHSSESSTALLLPTQSKEDYHVAVSPLSSPTSTFRSPLALSSDGVYCSPNNSLDESPATVSALSEPHHPHSAFTPASESPIRPRRKLRKPPPAVFALIDPAMPFPENSNTGTLDSKVSSLSNSPSSTMSHTRRTSSSTTQRKLLKRPSSAAFYKNLDSEAVLKEVSPNSQPSEKSPAIFSSPPRPHLNTRGETTSPLTRPRSAPHPRRTLSAAISLTVLRAVRSKSRRNAPSGPAEPEVGQDGEWLPPMRAISPFGKTMSLVSPTWTPLVMTDSSGSSSGHNPSSPSTSATSASSSDHAQPKRTKSGRWSIGADDDNDDVESECVFLASSHMCARPHLHRRDAAVGVRRRWSLAAAMTDEGISDEVIVAELERIRYGSALSESTHSNSHEEEMHTDADVYGGPSVWLRDQDARRTLVTPLPSPTGPALPVSSAAWLAARRALLTCRELVRTERHYLNSLRVLLAGNSTRTPPPPLMLQYARALAAASAAFLTELEDDPSAWGVATAFCRNGSALEAAFVAWCGVVGVWFVGPDDSTAERRRGRLGSSRSGASTPKHSPPRAWDAAGTVRDAATALTAERPQSRGGSLRRSVSTWRKSMPSIAGLAPVPPPPLPVDDEKPCEERPRVRGLHAVRDLAILPTQRVMRYVLLYRDLLAYTPASSPSRVLVERAVDAAVFITQKCDRAQGNAAFLLNH